MSELLRKMNFTNRLLMLILILLLTGAVPSSFGQEHRYHVQPWSFGVMGDTQWTLGNPSNPVDPAGNNPNFVSVSIIKQINKQFIAHGVKFVVGLGDNSNWGGDAATTTRADAAADLYQNQIGFFTMRGNHETFSNDGFSIPAFQKIFPQNRGKGDHVFGATNFSSPISLDSELDGMSYSFDYGNARLVIVDVMATANRKDDNLYKMLHLYFGYPLGMQWNWISGRLDKKTRGKEHAFVFSHQPLIAETHFDSPFGGYTDSNPEQQNAFFAGLQDNNVKYYISAHDHLHQRSVIASPDGKSHVEELIATPACPKFYNPVSADNPNWKGQKVRETALSQERLNIGFYIYTVDGPRVTVDHYSDARGNYKSDAGWPTGPDFQPPFEKNATPVFNFVKKETWGYSLNGKEFLIAQNSPYTSVTDTFKKTRMQILGGTNSSASVDGIRRPLVKKVATGWVEKPSHNTLLKSNILSLWGLAEPGAAKADTYVLSMTFQHKKNLRNGTVGIATPDTKGKWVNAVNWNSGGIKKFVTGPYKADYGLGTYGIDPRTKSAWAVIDYVADFAVATEIEEKKK